MDLKGFCSFHILLFTSPVEKPANIALTDPRISVLPTSQVGFQAGQFVETVVYCFYSGTRLIRTPRGHAIVSVLSGCPY